MIKTLWISLQLPNSWWRKLSLFAISVFFINVGVDHFVNPDFYLAIMPPSFTLHHEAVYISGLFEIIGGICILIPSLRRFTGWGLLALLVAVYPANIYMALNPDVFAEIPVELLYVRLAFQFVFFYWAYSMTRDSFNPGTVKRVE
ncbi:MAG: DoxX family protein [Porticoccaceae bacterium]|nr:DoxX family protein [Porticoccaceae bacterium]MDG2116148.1 DoxX family protein [Porticoccaceae bacterium]|tara:strand:+ start:387 stop:821 length:435 start_codon:yes stop_codon:yes gene_type:complete